MEQTDRPISEKPNKKGIIPAIIKGLKTFVMSGITLGLAAACQSDFVTRETATNIEPTIAKNETLALTQLSPDKNYAAFGLLIIRPSDRTEAFDLIKDSQIVKVLDIKECYDQQVLLWTGLTGAYDDGRQVICNEGLGNISTAIIRDTNKTNSPHLITGVGGLQGQAITNLRTSR